MHRQRTGRTIVNAILDTDELGQRESQLQFNPAGVYYKDFDPVTHQKTSTPLMPRGELASSYKVPFDYEVGLVPRRDGLSRSSFTPDSKGQLPVSSTWNGEIGDSVADLQRRKRPAGIYEKPGALIIRGAVTVTKELAEPWFAGDRVMAVPPFQDEVNPRESKLTPPNGELATRKGRVHSVLRVYDPHTHNFFDAEAVLPMLKKMLQPNPTTQLRARNLSLKPDSDWDNAGNMYLSDISFCNVIKKLIHVIMNFKRVANPAADPVQGDESDAIHLFVAAVCFSATTIMNGKALFDDFYTDIHANPAYNIPATHTALIKDNPLAALLSAVAALIFEVTGCLMGTVMQGAEQGGGKSAVVHLH